MKAKEALQVARKKTEEGQPQTAIRILQKIQIKIPQNLQVLEALAQTYETTGQYADAIDCMNKIIDLSGDSEKWRHLLKRAGLYRKTERFDDATSDYSQALAYVPLEEAQFKQFIESALASCEVAVSSGSSLSSGQTESVEYFPSEEIVKAGAESVANTSEADACVKNIEKQPRPLEETVEEFVTKNPDQAVAISIARDIYHIANGAAPDFSEADATTFSKSAQQHCNHVKSLLTFNGFDTIGDFIPAHLSDFFGRDVLMRLFVSKDRAICAASYKLEPQKSGLSGWFQNLLKRSRSKSDILELVTEFSDGRFFITNNSGDQAPFEYGRRIKTNYFPPKTPRAILIESHKAGVEEYLLNERKENASFSSVRVEDLDELVASHNRIRLVKNEYRKSVGFVTEIELRRLLGKQYEKFAEPVKDWLTKLMAASAEAS